MSRKSVLLSWLGRGLIILIGGAFALEASAALSFSPSSVTGTIHYSPATPALTVTAPTATLVNTPSQTWTGSLNTAGNLSINGVNVALTPSQAFSYPVTLSQGDNTFTFLGVDLGGNRVTLTKTITLDTIPPATPNTSLITVSVTGGQATLTGAPGSVDPSTQITVTDTTTSASVTVTSDANGAFSATLTAQSGDQLTITATDAAGNTSGASFRVDTTAPTITLTSPSGSYTNQANMTFVGSLSEAGALKVNGSAVTVNGDLSFSYAVSLLEGSNSFTFVAKDASNNQTTVTRTITLDTIPPSVPNTGDIDVSTSSSGSVTVTGTAGAVDAGTPITILDVTTGASVTVTSDGTGAFSAILAAQAGDQLTITATDAAGNTSSAGEVVPTPDTTPPTITITSPASAATNQASLTITGSLNEAGTLTINGNPVTVNADHSFSYAVTLVAGDNSFTFLATDLAGNPTTVTRTVTLDTTAPVVTVTSPTFTLTNLASVTFTGSLSEAGTLVVNGNAVTVNPDLTFSYDASLVPGANTFIFVAKDAANNTGSLTRTIARDNTAPTINITSPSSNYANQAALFITGSLSEAGTLTINGAPVTVNADLSFSASMTLVAGANAIHFVATDQAGNQTIADRSVTLDTTAPVLTVTSPSIALTNQASLTLAGSVDEAGTLTVNGAAVTVNADLSFSAQVTLAEGANSFTFVAKDLATNQTTVTRTITLDTIAPAVPNLSLITVSPVSGGQTTVTGAAGSVDASTSITVRDDTSGVSVNVTSSAAGAFSASFAALTGDPLTITATDPAGNTGIAHTQVPGPDTIPPTITITAPTGAFANQAHLTITGHLSEAGTLTVNSIPVTVNPDLTFSYAATLNEGPNDFVFAATDLAGNPASLTRTITLDTLLPSTPNTRFISASAVSGGQTTVTGIGGAVDPNIQVTITNQRTGAHVNTTAGPIGTFSAVLAAQASDVLMVVATDQAGNNAAAAVQVPGQDVIPPVVTYVTPPSFTNQTTYTFTGSVSEPVTLYLDMPMSRIAVPVKPDLTFSITVALFQGNGQYSYEAYDAAGNVNTNRVGFGIDFDDVPPVITFTSTQHTGHANFTLTGKVDDAANGMATINGIPVSMTYNAGTRNWSFAYALTLAEGENDVTVSVTDYAGNTSTVVDPIYLNSGPQTIAVTSPTSVNYDSYTITGQLSKEGTLTVNGAAATVHPDLSFAYQVPAPLTEGSNSFDLVATDNAGSPVSQTLTVTLDTTAPTITIDGPAGPYTNQSTVTLVGSVDDATAVLTINDVTVPVNPDGTFSYPVTFSEHEGFNMAWLTATDAAGNVGFQSWFIIVDSTAPVIDWTQLSALDEGNGYIAFSGIVDNFPNSDSDVAMSISGIADGASGGAQPDDPSGYFEAEMQGDATQPFNVTALDAAGNLTSMRVQFGTACYADPNTHNAMLTVDEGSGTVTGPLGGTEVFHVTRAGVLGFDTYVDYRTDGATAVAGQEYSGSLKIPAGATGADLSIPLLGGSSGPDQTFTLNILGTHNPIGQSRGNTEWTGADFAPRQQPAHAVGNNPVWGATADFNGDGKPDVATVNSGSDGNENANGTLSVLLNNTPDGADHETFADAQTISAGLWPTSIAAADVNHDGRPDLLVTNATGNGPTDGDIMVFLNTTSPGSPTVSFELQPTLPTGSYGPMVVTAVDLNGDGKLDLVAGNDDHDSTVSVLFNTTADGAPTVSFTGPYTFPSGPGTTFDVVVADLNRDGRPDIIAAYAGLDPYFADAGMAVLLNTTAAGASAPSFAAYQSLTVNSYVNTVAVGDMNGDGIPDVVSTGGPPIGPGEASIAVLTNHTAPGAMTLNFGSPQFFTTGSDYTLALADLDGDGKLDIAAANISDAFGQTGSVSVLANTTSAGADVLTFAPHTIYATGAFPNTLLLEDLNHDGKPDIVTVDMFDSTVSVLMNQIAAPGYAPSGSCVMPASITGTVHFDVEAPVITLTSPTATSFQSPYQTLVGHVSGAHGPLTLTMNGALVPLVADGSFSVNVILLFGSNSFTLAATDAQQNTGSLTVTLTLTDAALPAPAAGSIQFQSGGSGLVTITGTAPVGSTGVTVLDVTNGNSVNGTVDGNGGFSVTLIGNLSDEFSVTFTDAGGGQSTPVYAQGTDPTLDVTVTSPTAGSSIAAKTVDVTGTYAGPLDTGITVDGRIATLINGHFYVNNLQLKPGASTITVVATTLGGLSLTRTVAVSSTGPAAITLTLPVDTGITYLNAFFQYTYTGTAALQTLEMDYLGTGFQVEATGATQIAAFAPAYTYGEPGVYPASIRLTDVNGVQYQATVYIVVQDPAQMDALFTKVWGDMTAALITGSKVGALSTLTNAAQQDYAPVFDDLMPDMPAIVSGFSSLMRSTIAGHGAEYGLTRMLDGQAHLYMIGFQQGPDGVWRVDSM